MKLAIMQPYFFPYIGYFQAIYAVDKYILYSNLNFIKESWMNRNRISIKDGSVSIISVPLIHKSSSTQIYDIQIDNTKKWNTKILKSIFLNYKKSKYFDGVFALLEKLLNEPYVYLYELNANIIINIARFVGITTTIEYNNILKYFELEEQLSKDEYTYLPYMENAHPIKKAARVLAICNYEGADTFINAIGGQALYDKHEFEQYGIDLKFIHTEELKYAQFSKGFIPNLSIIDVLMHNGKEGTMKLLKKYTLI